jgi:hypothetical protein
LECHYASQYHLLEFGFFLDSINLGFLLREKLVAVLIIPSSWGSQLDRDLHHQHRAASRLYLALLPGIEEEEAPTLTTFSHVNYAPADGFGRSFSVASSTIFSCESAVCSRVES